MDSLTAETKPNPKVKAFLEALPLASDEQFVTVPGLGVFRARHVRRGIERGVLVVHWTGLGFALAQPATHAVCPHCASRKGTVCTHCACAMCSWFRQTDELISPRVSQEKMLQLTRRIRTFQMRALQPATAPSLDDDI